MVQMAAVRDGAVLFQVEVPMGVTVVAAPVKHSIAVRVDRSTPKPARGAVPPILGSNGYSNRPSWSAGGGRGVGVRFHFVLSFQYGTELVSVLTKGPDSIMSTCRKGGHFPGVSGWI